ncbi:hypothetical protein K490DRAFT_61771 [Saccharata proteae CBS 121410]|uniref:Uncharacterized protein n=1 Tax=Saccharata proteae CBS 121410 TaxID=1314787 RepID=A0A9P4I3I1_9PEZI|nr:hypothetical protein K490DRAFT_61771 [Saccharata proteae CBS 121410]
MPPIPVHLNAPINPNAAKADGISPETATGQQQPQPTRTTNASTATAFDSSLPPPPQPGAVPQPFSAAPTPTSASPPRPQPGASATTGYIPATVTATVTNTITQPVGPPPQFFIPPPTTDANPTRSTTAAAAPAHAAYPGPTTLNMGPAPTMSAVSEHPPGYVQNPYAGDGTAAQRARLEDVKAQEEGEGEGVWGSVKGVLGRMGEGLKKGEEEAWKFVEGRKGSGF